MSGSDYSALIALAREVARPIYPSEDCQAGTVGAVIVSSSDKAYTGVCLDFACSLGFCAEHAAIAEMLKNHESEISHVVAVTHEGEVLPPCGRCREMMWQLNKANKSAVVVLGAYEDRPLSELLPFR
jgi:cytidine deaminase